MKAHSTQQTARYISPERNLQLSFLMTTPNKEQLFAQVYATYSDALFRHCLSRLSDQQMAENIMQETFARAWSYLIRGNEVKNMRALLYKIANNLIVDRYRAKKSLSLEALQENNVTFDVDETNTLLDRLEVKEVAARIEKLDPKYREVIIMRYFKELSLVEIKKVLGVSENAIAVRIHRGLKQFRELP